ARHPGRYRAAPRPEGARKVPDPAPDRGGERRVGGAVDRPVARGARRGDGPERVPRHGPSRGLPPSVEPPAPRVVLPEQAVAGAGEAAQAPRRRRGRVVRGALRGERVGTLRPLGGARTAVRQDRHRLGPRRDAGVRLYARDVHRPGAAGARRQLEAAAPAGVVRRPAVARARPRVGRVGAACHPSLRGDHGLRRLRVPRAYKARRRRGADPPGPRRRGYVGVGPDLRRAV
ncbi:MAG: hypothetical protein AVDCRST_MAG02-1131, partial [uncultured Rubrobacteraceae bacterium]